MMEEKKYELVAWTRNITDVENARLYMVPSVEYELLEPLFAEVCECRKEMERAGGSVSPELAGRFARVYEQSARLDLLTGHIDSAIRFLRLAADYCGELPHESARLCEEAAMLARKHGLYHYSKPHH